MRSHRLNVSVLGLGRMGTALAARLADHHRVRTWSRRMGGSPNDVVVGADVVVVSLFDGPACEKVLTECLPALSATCAVVNTTTVGTDEATWLEAMVTSTGATYLHAPVMGSTPAIESGRLTILAGGVPTPSAAAVLEHLGQTLVFPGAAHAAALKLLANGVLGDAVTGLRRTIARGQTLGLPADDVVDLTARTILGRLVEGKRDELTGRPGTGAAATFAVDALAKDLALLAAETGSGGKARADVETLMSTPSLRRDDDIIRIGTAAPDLAWLSDARLDVSPEIVADPEVLRPLHAYALTHATGDPRHLSDAFLPSARVEGRRGDEFVSWDLESYAALFPGHPEDDEPSRARRVEQLDVTGAAATATMVLRHGANVFHDVFVLLRTQGSGEWRIVSKAFERAPASDH
jgi:3-hydroxyisobutyrate dehydrogenase-like beta-hydroxyacid dehydrogenase